MPQPQQHVTYFVHIIEWRTDDLIDEQQNQTTSLESGTNTERDQTPAERQRILTQRTGKPGREPLEHTPQQNIPAGDPR